MKFVDALIKSIDVECFFSVLLMAIKPRFSDYINFAYKIFSAWSQEDNWSEIITVINCMIKVK